jgi:PAS domain S-box-containing protein
MSETPELSTLREENAALRKRLAEAEERLHLFEALVEHAVDGVAYANVDGQLLYANPALLAMNGVESLDEYLSYNPSDFIDPEDLERYRNEVYAALNTAGRFQGYSWGIRKDGTRWRAFNSNFLVTDSDGNMIGQASFTRDVTAQHNAEEERQRLQEEVIMAQDAVLRELSTPLVPIADGVIAMPLVGAIDTRRAHQIMEALLEGISEQQAETAILDITGVKVVDTQVASALLRAAQAARLLGTRVVLTGIGAEVAQALVHLGADMQGIVTLSNLQSGIAYAMSAEHL